MDHAGLFAYYVLKLFFGPNWPIGWIFLAFFGAMWLWRKGHQP